MAAGYQSVTISLMMMMVMVMMLDIVGDGDGRVMMEVMVKMLQMMLAMTIRQSITIRKMPRLAKVPLPPSLLLSN